MRRLPRLIRPGGNVLNVCQIRRLRLIWQVAANLTDDAKTVHLIGGCDVAMELDARRAIAQGTRLALEI
ncbi:hypothetical protein B1T56_19725 [Escherichia coli]|nr:hypothetical protein B1T56_19725 [Escherichia coli]